MKAIGRKPTDKESEKHKKMILKRYQAICDKIILRIVDIQE